jgi:gluconokinase
MLTAMVIIVTGVTGSGKSTVGSQLAADLQWPFYDGDAFHPPANVAKMSKGIALTDDDRQPWLQAIRSRIDALRAARQSAVVVCSALKASYREVLSAGAPEVRFVYLHGDAPLLAERLRHRIGHFMDPALLKSQLATLEEPADAVRIEVALPVSAQVHRIREALGLIPLTNDE